MITFDLILKAFIFIAPAYVANMAPAIFGSGKPVDNYATFRGKRLLGDGKTIKGTLFGIIAGTIAGAVIGFFYQNILFYSLFGLITGIGAMLGDMIASFAKRQMNIKRGQPAPLLDQIDFALGAMLVGSFMIRITSEQCLVILIATPFLHFIVNVVGYWIGVKKVPW